MSQLQQHLPAEVIAAASTRELVEAAQTLLRAAFDNARDKGHDNNPEQARGEGAGAGLSDGELLDQVLLTQQVQNSAWATQTVRLQQLAEREYAKHPDHPGNWTPLEVGARLGWTDRQTNLRLTQAIDAVRCAPRLLDHAGAGNVEGRKVTAVSGVLADAPDLPEASTSAADLAAVIEDEIFTGDPAGSTSSKLHRRAQRLLVKHAPVQADQAASKRRRGYTDVTVEPHWEPGLSTIHATMPALDAAKLMAAINSHARLLHQSTTTGKSLGECRVDALIDLVLSEVQVSTELVLHVPFHPDWTARADETTAGDEASTANRRTNVDEATSADRRANVDKTATASRRTGTDTAGSMGELGEMRPPGPPEYTVVIDPLRLGSSPGRPSSVIEREFERRLEHHFQTHLARAAVLDDTRPPPGLTHFQNHRTDPAHYTDPARQQDPARYRLGDVQLPGAGVVPAAAIRELTRLLGTTLTRALVDSRTGITAETASHSYTPGARLARFVRTRDQHCRFPGCTRPAKLTDLDHVTRYPDGPTAAGNLQCLCRHHHRAKHEGGWQVAMTPDGVCTWTSPAGHTYLTRPDD